MSVIAQTNQGQGAAFAAGTAATTAPWVLFLDADDVVFAALGDELVDLLPRLDESTGRVMFRLRHIDATGAELPGSLPETGRTLPSGDLRSAVMDRPDDIAWQPTSGNVFARHVLDAILPMDAEAYRISADHYLSNVGALYGTVVAIEAELGGYRIHGDNADHRADFDPARARSILQRSDHTHAALVLHARALGLNSGTPGERSSTLAGLRLASLRTEPDAHPYPGDDRFDLAAKAGRALLARRDLSVARKMLGLGWVAAVTLAPRRVVGRLVPLGLTR